MVMTNKVLSDNNRHQGDKHLHSLS